jgi:hypothetical protein
LNRVQTAGRQRYLLVFPGRAVDVPSARYLVLVFNAGAAIEWRTFSKYGAAFRRGGAITFVALSAVAPAEVGFWVADCMRDGEQGCRVEVPRNFDIDNAGTAIYQG